MEQRTLIEFPTEETIPASVRQDTSSFAGQYLINGEIRTWNGPRSLARSPVCVRTKNGSLERCVVGEMANLDPKEALAALDAAKRAWDFGRGPWPTMRVAKRIDCMETFVEGMAKEREPVVRLLMWEIGKTRKDAESEFDRTVVYIRDTIASLKDLDRTSNRFVLEEQFIGQIRRAPLGVVLCMGPFNYPLNETYATLIPALIMGNTVVSKLPRYGSLLHLPLLKAMQTAFPQGVVNIIQGSGSSIVGPIMQTGDVDALAFIGTSKVANVLKKQHPRPNRLRCVLGLEAKNPAIVMPSADLYQAVKECVSGSLSYNGQRCTAIKLIFVHESVASQFVERFCAAVDALKAGMPWEAGVHVTPLPEDGKPEYLSRLVEEALSHGARVVNAGGATSATFYRPAVVFPVNPKAELYSSEQFGPVVPIATYRDEREIDEFMSHSPYGQQASIFGTDPKAMASMVDAIANQVCRININSQCRRGPDTFPFTGRKDSAEGTLSVSDALRVFSIRTVVSTASDEINKDLVSEIVTRRMSSFISTDFIF